MLGDRPASSIRVFIAQLVEHFSTNAEATGSDLCNCLNCNSTAMVTYSFHAKLQSPKTLAFCLSLVLR